MIIGVLHGQLEHHIATGTPDELAALVQCVGDALAARLGPLPSAFVQAGAQAMYEAIQRHVSVRVIVREEATNG